MSRLTKIFIYYRWQIKQLQTFPNRLPLFAQEIKIKLLTILFCAAILILLPFSIFHRLFINPLVSGWNMSDELAEDMLKKIKESPQN